ncbi:DUF4294 domain-containing protein [Salibacteraceae bacterium]|nr:DUF4294 domain-containing protein [Salibacteraceae bacterium]
MTFEYWVTMKAKTVFSFLIIFISLGAMPRSAQAQTGSDGIVMIAEIFDGDTFPVKYMPYIDIVAERTFKSKTAKKRFRRLQYNVKKMYPYAKLAGELLKKYEVELAGVDSDRQRKKYYKEIEKELKKEFDGEIRKMSTSQGKILIKLIDRETGDTSYEILQEFRGNMSAFFWQSFSKMFGQDLRSAYEPYGADREIESIVQLIEAGAI